MESPAEALSTRSLYKLMTGAIVPRPIGWISTVDMEGVRNLAPFSYFNAASSNPPHVLFCTGIRAVDRQPKDTLRNVRATGEFVVNIVTESLVEAMNLTATEFPPEVDEFEVAGLTPVPSVAVRPPRVGESPIHLECRVAHILELGAEPGGGSVVVGRVVHLHVRDDLLQEADTIDLAKLRPLGRLAGPAYCRVTDLLEIPRPPSQLRASS